jgi:hypothetical protein
VYINELSKARGRGRFFLLYELIYTLEWQNLIQLRHGNVGPTTLKAGDRVIVKGSPPRDPTSHTITLVREIERPADGWRWRRTTRQ